MLNVYALHIYTCNPCRKDNCVARLINLSILICMKTGASLTRDHLSFSHEKHFLLCIPDSYNCSMSRLMTKPPKWHVRPAKTQISVDAQANLSLRWAHCHIVGFVMRRLIFPAQL